MSNFRVREAIMSRHSDDLVVEECKDGPSQSTNHLRLDYWVLRRSWSKPAMIGYECKSGRKDFLSDKKWQGYLPLCNELWFIAPKDAIDPAELPETVGLLRIAGSRLITVRKAVWREIEPPVYLLTYVLMCRAAIKGEYNAASKLDHWRGWLAQKEERREVGYLVSKTLRSKFEHDVNEVRNENRSLQREIKALTELKDALKAKGIEWTSWTSAQTALDGLLAPRWQRSRIETARDALNELLGEGSREAVTS